MNTDTQRVLDILGQRTPAMLYPQFNEVVEACSIPLNTKKPTWVEFTTQHRTELTFMQAYGKLVELKVRTGIGDTVNLEQIPEVFHQDLDQYNLRMGGYAGETSFPGYIFSRWFDHVYHNGTSYPVQFKTELV